MNDMAEESIHAKLKELQEQLDDIGTEKVVKNLGGLDLPREFSLTPQEIVYVDSILWRQEAAELKIKLGKIELDGCQGMRQSLAHQLVERMGINPETHTVSINSETKRATVLPKRDK